MSDKKIKVYFLGAGCFAVPVLEVLLNSKKIDLLGAGTQPDRPSGRKRKLTPSPVGLFAESKGFDIEKPVSVNDPGYIKRLEALAPDFIVVVSFGQILKEAVLSLPSVCCLNIHASLLPKYRGASPVVSSILSGDKVAGVSFMEMEKGLDTGAVYSNLEYECTGKERCDELEETLSRLASENIVGTLKKINNGELKPVPQDDSAASLCGKIRKSDGNINWNEPAEILFRKARAYYPWPCLSFEVEKGKKNIKLKISRAAKVQGMRGTPGEILAANKDKWVIACGENALEILEVVPQGKKEMRGADFLRGCPLQNGTILKSSMH